MFSTPFSIAAIATVALISIYNSFQEQNKMTPKPKLNVHSFPRPPLLEKTPRHLVIKWGSNGNETTVADTRDAYWALETTHPPSMNCHSSTCPADFFYFLTLIAMFLQLQNQFSLHLSILPTTIITLHLRHVDTDPWEIFIM